MGVVIDGCPPRLPISREEIQVELDRRRPGQSKITTQRKEADEVEILSGVEDGLTTGTSIALLVRNSDQRSGDYEEMRTKYRPSHADYTYQAKYGIRSWKGGGRASARETIGRVAAGAVARKLLQLQAAVEIVAYVRRVETLEAEIDPGSVGRPDVEANIVRCPDAAAAEQMIARIDEARRAGDSLGGVVECVCRRVPVVIPSSTPERISTSSASRRWVVIRLCPGRRRSSSTWISSREMGSRGGQPSMTTPTAGPCDSPKVVMRKSWPNELDTVSETYHTRARSNSRATARVEVGG